MFPLMPATCFLAAFTTNPPRQIPACNWRVKSLAAAPAAHAFTEDITQDRYDDLLKWFLSKNERSYVSSKFEIRPSTCGGFGAFACGDLEEGELLLRIPRACCVTLDDAFNDVDCGPAFKRLMEQAGPGSDTVIIAGYLAKEYLLAQEYDRRLREVENGVLVDSSARKRLERIKYGPYLRSLPWKAGVNAQDHILFWEAGDVDSLFKGSLAYEDAFEIRNSVRQATKILAGMIGPTVSKARGMEDVQDDTSGFRLPWQAKKTNDVSYTDLEGLEEAICGAFVICLSRSFACKFTKEDMKEEECLIPVLDILQHSNDPNVSMVNADQSNLIEVKAAVAVKAGDELFNQYKPEDDANMPYHKFFTRFGFVPGVTEPIVNLVKNRSTIFFPKQQVV
ncbi:hypothetical protein HJC23_002811 [Cyclotella cryptica]|uniref:SET domain-containing protein n=1 Tax=Cyclotella cryptica TaxID=29204 RepID=A0ABD3PPD5_9STRA|eukprot:CCRYP_013081-RA/>CCRYP_013081-RA protein AED:0.09 eAED:0.09 QI:0/-1/0/1/-1/1/1/0/392